MKILSKIDKVIGKILVPSLSAAYFRFYILSPIIIISFAEDTNQWVLRYFGEFGIIVGGISVMYYIWLIAVIAVLLIYNDKKDEQQ